MVSDDEVRVVSMIGTIEEGGSEGQTRKGERWPFLTDPILEDAICLSPVPVHCLITVHVLPSKGEGKLT